MSETPTPYGEPRRPNPWRGFVLVEDPSMPVDEVRLESPTDPQHWVTLNLRTNEGVTVTAEGIIPFKIVML